MGRGAFLSSFGLVSVFLLSSVITGCSNSASDKTTYRKHEVQRLFVEGNNLMKAHRYSDAFDRYYRGLLSAREANDRCALLQFNNQLGLVKYRQDKFREAIPYIKEALNQRKYCADSVKYEPYGMQNTIALAYEQSGTPDSAIAYYNMALAAIERSNQTTQKANAARGMIYGNLGGLYERMNNYRFSECYLKASIAINDRPGFEQNDAITAEIKLAKLYLKMERPVSADSILKQAKTDLDRQEAAQDMSVRSKLDWYYIRWLYYDKVDQPIAAYTTLKCYHQLNDSVKAISKGLQYADMEQSFKASKQRQQLELSTKDNEIKKMSLLLTTTLIVLVVVIAVLIALNLHRSNKQNKRLQETLNALEESQHFLQGLLNNLPIILYQIDADGIITNSTSAGLQSVEGWSNDQLLGLDAFTVAPDLADAFRQAMSGTPARVVNAFAIDYSEFYFDTIILPDRNKPGCIIGFAVDTTAINQQAARLEELNKFKDKILSVISHDLRAPFSSIIMASEVLKLKSKHISGDELSTIMLGLRDTAAKSIGLLEGLLLWAQSEQRNFVYKPQSVNLHDNVNEANGVYQYTQQRKHINIQNNIPTDLTLMAHQQMLLFINRNLISNATKYSPDGGTINISAKVKAGEVILTVADEGSGMTAEQLGKLFKIGESHIRDQFHGAGIALSICYDMILQMNGRIWAESQPGRGSRFCYALPVLDS